MSRNSRRWKRWLAGALALVGVLVVTFMAYVNDYYHADASCARALESDAVVSVVQTDYGWLFDGSADDAALVFYPGAKVEETSYAPLLHSLASEGMDVCLVRMPFRLAVLGANKATDVMRRYSYDSWYVGGHSLGGAMAANYAANNADELAGVLLLAAYPTKELDDGLVEISIHGTEDGVLDRDRLEEGRAFAPDLLRELAIDGGNHAQFGNYGDQEGDGVASVSADDQQDQTVEFVLETLDLLSQ